METDAVEPAEPAEPPDMLALVIAWSREQPDRVGEVLLPTPPRLGGRPLWGFGRTVGGPDRLQPIRQHPGFNEARPAFADRRLSRVQWTVVVDDHALTIENRGRRKLLVDGQECPRAAVREGAVLEIQNRMLMLVVRRPPELPWVELPDALRPAFGTADEFGLVGESPMMWRLRTQLAFVAGRTTHVLIAGPRGSGKGSVARAIHGLSTRSDGEFVRRTPATVTDALADGAATVFLDDVDALDDRGRIQLLRMLVEHPEVRLIAATCKSLDELDDELAARLTLRVHTPALDAHREDVPLLIPALVRRLARRDPELARRFPDASGTPAIDHALVEGLIRRPYETHVRELESLLRLAMERTVALGRFRIGLSDHRLGSPTRH